MQLRQRFADDVIDPLVQVINDMGITIALLGEAPRVLRIAITPEHVLNEIGRSEIREQATSSQLIQGFEVFRNLLLQDDICLLEELILLERAPAQRLGVLRDARGIEPPVRRGQSGGEVGRLADGIRRAFRITGLTYNFTFGCTCFA